MAKPLKSANVSTNNILLKVTVPKRTGLKRRRGAEGPYHEGAEVGVLGERAVPMVNDARYLFRSMSDNSKSYQVEAVGTINQTHRFRGMRTMFPDGGFLCADTIRHAGLRDLDRGHATNAEVPRTRTAIRL